MELLHRNGAKIIEHFVVRLQQAIHFEEKIVKFGGLNFNVEESHLMFATIHPKYSQNSKNITPFLKVGNLHNI